MTAVEKQVTNNMGDTIPLFKKKEEYTLTRSKFSPSGAIMSLPPPLYFC